MIIKIKRSEVDEVLAGDGRVAGAPPIIHYGMELPITLEIYHDDAKTTPFSEEELAIFVALQFAVDNDWTDTTNPALIISDGFVISGNTISFTLLTNTQKFLDILDNKESAPATAELKGWKLGAELPAITIQFGVLLKSAVVSGTASPPSETISQYMLSAAIRALIANCEVRILPIDVDFTIAQQNVIYTVPEGKLFKPDFGKLITKELDTFGAGLEYQLWAGLVNLMPVAASSMDAQYAFDDMELAPEQYFPGGTQIIFEVVNPATSLTQTGSAQIKGDLIDA